MGLYDDRSRELAVYREVWLAISVEDHKFTHKIITSILDKFLENEKHDLRKYRLNVRRVFVLRIA
jgi:hypothetical protein